MTRHVVTLNPGSSSIKFALFEAAGAELSALAIGLVEMRGDQRRITIHDGAGKPGQAAVWEADPATSFHTDALGRILAWRRDAFPDAQVVAAGHRGVHGGVHYAAPVIEASDRPEAAHYGTVGGGPRRNSL
jgi:acetate kinase